MKTLSQHIRDGLKLKKQIFDGLYDKYGTCTLGAAFESTVGSFPLFDHLKYRRKFYDLFPILAADAALNNKGG